MTAAPIDITAKTQDRLLNIQWSADHTSAFEFKYLRCHCGCANCVDESTGIRRLDIDSVAASISIADIAPVGNYAIKISWTDGHDTGLYSWDYLSRLCPCSACGGPKSFERRVSPH